MSKLVVFDWGGVIDDHLTKNHDWYSMIIKLVNSYTNDFSEDYIIKEYLKSIKDENNNSLGCSNNDFDTYSWIDRFCDKFDINTTYEEFLKRYSYESSKVYYYKDVVEYIKEIRSECKVAIFSNICKIDYERIDRQTNLNNFDFVFLSYEVGYEKPNSKAYIEVENKTKYKPSDILFIDDTKENIEVAKRRGWNTCLATGMELDKIKNNIKKHLNR